VTVEVRPASETAAAAIAEIYATHVSGGYATFETTAPDATEFVRRMLVRPRLPWLTAAVDGAVVGFAYAAAHRERAAYRWSVDVSVYLAPPAVGRRIGGALYAALLPELADLGYVSAFAGIALPNPASVRLHEAMGFAPVGVYRDVGYKLGAWRDVGWWQRRLADSLPAAPREPLEWRA
jgi:L-amino acid N-acyltransferase YncA